MKKRVLYSTFMFILMCQFGMAQLAPEEDYENKANKLGLKSDNEKYPPSRGIVLGIHGARETMFEIGYFNYKWGRNDGYGKGGGGYSISTEHYINRNYIIAPKIAGFSNFWDLNFGVAAVWYFDMEKNNSLRLRPELGYAKRDEYKLTYAFNMAITNKDMPNVSKHMLSFVYFLNFNRKAKK